MERKINSANNVVNYGTMRVYATAKEVIAMQLQTVADWAMIATPILLIAAIIFAYTQWRSGQNARMAQIMLTITERWDSKDMEDSRCRVNKAGKNLKEEIKKADTESLPELWSLVRVGNFFDSLGVMVVEGLLSCKIGYKLFGSAEEYYYELYKPVLQQEKYADYLKYFSELHDLFETEKATHKRKVKRRLRM
jgi:hypothetical protein